jgi:hypothetical protein
MSDYTNTGSPEFVYWVEPSCPANTSIDGATLTKVAISTVTLWRAEFRIPPGHAGLTGIALFDSGTCIVPFVDAGDAWLIGDDDLLEYNYGKMLGDNVYLRTYNTDDTYDHGWQVRLIYTPQSAVLVSANEITVGPLSLD